MRYGSVCSGIEAASVAWHGLGWRPSFLSEIEAFPCAVLKHHWRDAPLHGDFTTIKEGEYDPIDILVGGTPCQDFSVAGLRAGMAGDRGNLTLQFLTLACRLRPEWLVWENVPGVLSSNEGRDFGAFLGGLGELGYGWAYRTLDAQYFGVPQRRRRVFVIGHLGDWRRAAAVLFERHSLQGHPTPRRETGEGIAPTISSRPTGGGGMGTDFDLDGGIMIANSMTTKAGERGRDAGSQGYIIATPSTGDISHCLNGGGMGRQDYETETLISHALTGGGFDASEDGTGRGTPIIAFAQNQRDELREMPVAGALAAEPGMKQQTYIAFSSKDHGADAMDNLAPTLRAGTHSKSHANAGVPPAVTVALRGREGGATAEIGGEQATALRASQGGGDKPHVLAFQTRGSNVDIGDVSGTFGSNADRASGSAPMAFTLHGADKTVSTATQTELAGSIRTKPPGSIENSSTTVAFNGSAVRRLTPRECERLQGFPDDYTLVPFRGKPAADGPRYKALGNSMAVPVMRWLGERIALVHGRCRP